MKPPHTLTHTHPHTHTRYRQKQLIRQLPAYDIDIFYCNDDLTEDEKKQMELFVRMRRKKALCKGEVRLREPGNKTPQWVSTVTVEVGADTTGHFPTIVYSV